jgi:glycosyltransferase involved in cell wall biosynthesis
MHMNKPWLSVLMPTYNGEKFLSQALDSIILQNDKDIECIAVDDGSTDATCPILEAYAARLPLKIVREPHNGNWAANTNKALSCAQGEYISILHQDDMWLKDRLCIMKNLALQHPDSAMILNSSIFIDKDGKRLGSWRCPLPAYPAVIDTDTMIERLLIQNFISIPAPIVKREAALRVGGLDSSLWYTPDWDLWLKIGSYGKILYYPKPLTAFRIHRDSQTIARGIDIQGFRKDQEVVLDKHLDLLKVDGRAKKSVRQVAYFSIILNIFLANIYYGKQESLFDLAWNFLSLGPCGWYKYFRDSRIFERVICRIRSNLL